MKKPVYLYIILFCGLCHTGYSQLLKPGFDPKEYKELIYISARTTANAKYYNQFPEPASFNMVYQSPTMGVDNLWDLWTNKQSQAVISIRGTTGKPESWMANFYAAMVPAKGELILSPTDTFHYALATDPKAAVHVGWLLCTAYLSKDIVPKIDSCYKKGTREFLIMGHSQGGAISFLLTAYLYSLQKQGKLPSDIRFKTYCSAGPKPGNLYFAYEYEAMTQGGWAYNVVNSADWVPETPISIQTLNDFSTTNPFKHAKKFIKKQKFPQNLVLSHVFNKLDKPTRNAQKNYQKFLGKLASKLIQKNLKEFQTPQFYSSNDYVRTGNTIVLLATEEYYKVYPDNDTALFIHHTHQPYLYLLDRQFK